MKCKGTAAYYNYNNADAPHVTAGPVRCSWPPKKMRSAGYIRAEDRVSHKKPLLLQ